MAFDKKNIFHSELVIAGPTRINIQGDIRSGKKSDYVSIRVWDDPQEHNLTIENSTIRAQIADLPRNQWVEVVASGKRDDASLKITPVSTAPVKSVKSQSYTRTDSLEDEMVEAMLAAKSALHRIGDLSEQEYQLGISMFIERQRSGGTRRFQATAAPSAPAPPQGSPEPPAEKLFVDTLALGKKWSATPERPEGYTWAEVVELDPGYVEWAIENMKTLADWQKKALSDLLEQKEDPFTATEELFG